MKTNAIAGLLVALMSCVAASSHARAQTEDLDAVVQSGVCPSDTSPSDMVKYADHCAGMDEACAVNDSGCFEDARRCWDEVNRINKQIFKYNEFVRECAAHRK